MMRRYMLSGVLVASLLSVAVAGQALRQSGADLPAAPRAISGVASSARHCVAGDAANVHGLGWVTAGTSYTITFESTIALSTAVLRLDLTGNQGTSAFGTPDLRFTASTPGSMVLAVDGRGQSGCYRYKVEIQPPAASLAPAAAIALPALARVQPAAQPVTPTAISGLASSAKHCVTGNAAKTHGLGRIEQGASVRISFESDFDPVAGVTITNFAPERSTHLIDDNTGGGGQPLLLFTASQAGTVALHVASVGGRAGCYRFQVQITESTPTPTPTPAPAPTFAQFNGSWSGTFTGQASGTLAFSIASAVVTVTQPSQGDGTISLGSIQADGRFFTRGDLGECTWTGPFLPGGARQSSASGLWSCGNGRSGAWSATRAVVPTPTPTPAPTPAPAPAPAPAPSGGGMTYAGNGFINCTFNAGGVVSSCGPNSSVTVNITLRMAVGSSLKLVTDQGILSNTVVTSRSDPPGTITFTSFSGGGWFDRCGGPVREIGLINTSVNPNLVLARVTGISIPITCR